MFRKPAAGIRRKAVIFSLLIIFFLLLPSHPAQAARPAKIINCRLSSASRVSVSVQVPVLSKVHGKYCYLFTLPMSRSKLKASDRPVQKRAKAGLMTFSVPLYGAEAKSGLYKKYAVAQKNKDGTYSLITPCRYVTGLKKAAKYTYKFPTVSSKKGLQVAASMVEDAVKLNVKHSVVNIDFAAMIAPASARNSAVSFSYNYHGKTYWFLKNVIQYYDRQLKPLRETGCVNAAILLLSWRDDLTYLIHPSGRQRGHSFYAWNTVSASAREQLQASLSFLAQRYSAKNGKNGRIVNWIVGNEVNNYRVYNYAGEKTLKQYAQIYARSFRLTYQTVTSIYSNARVYISLDHLWNTNTVPGTFPSRSMLDAFVQSVEAGGSIGWNLAYHPYSSPLTEPKFWENANRQLTQALSSPVINMGNLSVLTGYIRNKYGTGHRIILSEQGYTSLQQKRDVQRAQAAAIAYSYMITENDDMVDSFIMNRHVDHQVEIAQGLNLGLWTDAKGAVESADTKKYAWDVFKYMDSSRTEEVTSFALGEIGADSWEDLFGEYDADRYKTYSAAKAKLGIVKTYAAKAGIAGGWKAYGASAGRKQISGGYRALHDPSRNRNALWGFTQTFKNKIFFTKYTKFYSTVKVSGSSGSKVFLKLRFFCGKHVLEASGKIKAGEEVRICVNLKNWKYAGKVSKIQVLAAPVGKAGWKGGAALSMTKTVRG